MELLDLRGQPLDLDLTLSCGQAFRWRKLENGVWQGVVGDKLFELKETDGSVFWRTYPAMDETRVRDYFRLDDDVNAVYARLSSRDSHLAAQIERFHGLRLVRQDPVETLLSFICSAANSIPRIMAAIGELARGFGNVVCEKNNVCYFSFPSIDRLAEADQSALEQTRSLAFRGKNLKSVAMKLREKSEDWLIGLRKKEYLEAVAELTSLYGVGRKIADCVCLFSLDKDEAVPVDTHVRQLAQRLFLPELKSKSITDATYRIIVDAFVERYGSYAGWAQQFLYYEDLLRTRALGRGLK